MRFKTTAKITTLLALVLLGACGTPAIIKPAVTTTTDISSTASEQSIQKIDDHLFVTALTALQQHDTDRAKRLFSRFIDTYPNLSGAYHNLALIYFNQQQYDQALDITNRAIAVNPSQPRAYQLRAQLKIKKGKIKEAKTDYLKAIQLNPTYSNAHYNLALLYDIYLQDIKSAIQHYETYMTLIDKPDEATREWINHLKRTLKNGQV